MTEYHFFPDLMELLVNTIPRLCRSYEATLMFFKGAGVHESLTRDLRQSVHAKEKINKFQIVRTILARLNESGDSMLRQRREIVRRVTEFEDFSTCWPDDQLEARGLVAQVRQIVNVKDSFTRIYDEHDKVRQRHIREQEEAIKAKQEHRQRCEKLKDRLFALFAGTNAAKRGKELESVLNDLFAVYGILVREAFTLTGSEAEGIVEQIDGVIELDGHLYFVEMKWWQEPLGRSEISEHLVRVYHRPQSRAIIISASKYTEPAISVCREALVMGKVVTLCTLEEVVGLLNTQLDLKVFLREKANRTITDKNPFPKVVDPS